MTLEGLVLLPACRPIAGAVIDIWHCDENGRYDNGGFRYRGYQYTDASGNFQFLTIKSGKYPGRTPHMHLKVKGPKTLLLTTQLYFPDHAHDNARDWGFKKIC